MRVFLTGGTGFVGSHLARLLVREGCEVTALVRPGADPRRIADVMARLHLVEGDLGDPEGVRRALVEAAPELCFHLAWYAQPGRYLTAPENLDCLAGSLGLLRGLEAAGCRHLIATGTCIEYDTDVGYLAEDSPLRPRTLYAASKLALWHVTEQLARLHGWCCAWARLFHPYGPWEPEGRLVPLVIQTLLAGEPCQLTKGDQLREFVHVEDVARGLWAIAMTGLQGPVNVASGEPTGVADLARRIAGLLGRPELLRLGALPTPPGEPPVVCAVPGRLRTQAGWTPRYDLDTGLRDSVAWWRARRR